MAMAAEYAGTLVKVPLDVDVYDQPGGEGNKRPQFLKGGSQVYLLKEEHHWCNVQGDVVPGGPGWIWCGIGDDKQDYSLKPVAAAPAPAAEPVKSDCKIIGPNEEAAGGSSDPKIKYECEDLDGGKKECCWVKYP
jgi:hypothetical protein